MPNILKTEKKIAVIAALAEGMAIRQIERMTDIHRDTIMRLGVRVGKGCAAIMDAKMRDLNCTNIKLMSFGDSSKEEAQPYAGR
jgi:hypothetical protein